MKKLSKYAMFIIGFVLLIINAVGYVFDLGFKHPAFTVLGIVFVVIGMKKTKNKL